MKPSPGANFKPFVAEYETELLNPVYESLLLLANRPHLALFAIGYLAGATSVSWYCNGHAFHPLSSSGTGAAITNYWGR